MKLQQQKLSYKLFYNNTSATSAILLANKLRDLDVKLLATNNPDRIANFHTVIRYGNSLPVPGKELVDTAEFISLVSNKWNFSKKMEENNIYSPIYQRSLDGLEFPVMIRESLTSSGGKGIHIVENLEEFNKFFKGTYVTKFVPLEFELRVHVLGGEIVKIFKKEPMEGTDIRIKNNDSCHFSIREEEKYPKLDELVKQLSNLFPQQFFGMDVGWDKKNKKYFLIEINSAPGLNEETAGRYAEYIKSILSGGICQSSNCQDTII